MKNRTRIIVIIGIALLITIASIAATTANDLPGTLATTTTIPSAVSRSTMPSQELLTTATSTSTTRAEGPPTQIERQELIERYVHYTALYESSMIDFLVELGLNTREGIENRIMLGSTTGVGVRDFERAIGNTIVCETHLDRFLAENELENAGSEILSVRPEKPFVNKTVEKIESNGTTSVQVWGTTYTGYVYTVTVDVADGTTEVYNVTVIYFFDKYVISACEPVVA